MGSSTYRVFEKQDNRRFKLEVILSVVIGLVILGGATYVLLDLNRNPDVIDDSENVAVLGEFESDIERYASFETDRYTLELPEDWVQVNNPEKLINRKRYYPDRFQGVERDDVGKWLEVYYGDDLPDMVLDRVLSISASGSTVTVGSISPRCSEFTESVGNLDGTESVTTWQDLSFVCSMNSVTNVIGAFETTSDLGAFLKGEQTQDNYLFVFGDHSSKPNNNSFQRIMRTFKVK